jgi:hypothetical protein
MTKLVVSIMVNTHPPNERVNMEGCLLNSHHPNQSFSKLQDHLSTPAVIQLRGQYQIMNILAGPQCCQILVEILSRGSHWQPQQFK